MLVGERLRKLREEKKLSQGHIEQRTGLLRCYISRVENGHTVPAVETIEKLARALEVPLYQIFYTGEKPPEVLDLPGSVGGSAEWGSSGKDAKTLSQFRRLLGRMKESDRTLLLLTAHKMTPRHRVRKKK